MSRIVVVAILAIFNQYFQFVNLNAAPQDFAPSDLVHLKDSNGQFDDGHDQAHEPGPAPSALRRNAREAINKYDLHLKEYLNYAASVNLRNMTQFPCVRTPATTCSLTLTPPENHGLMVVIQKLNIRLNIRPSLGEVCTLSSTAAAWPPYTPLCQCRDYLKVYGAGLDDSSAKLCGRFERKQNSASSGVRVPYFVGESTQYSFPVNAKVRLTLFHGYDSPYDNDAYLWHLNGEIGGTISVTSYFDCSNLDSWERLGYKNCSPSGAQCISSSLFCDGVTNCKYDESSQSQGQSDGQDEADCFAISSPKPTSLVSSAQSPPSPSQLLPVGSTTTAKTITTFYRATSPSPSAPVSISQKGDSGIPVYTYRDLRKQSSSAGAGMGSETNSFPDGSTSLTTTFVFTVFCVVILLTLFFGGLKLAFQSSSNYVTNEPLERSGGNGGLARANSTASIDTVDRVIAGTEPPPEYPEVSGLPSYDSLFKEAAAAAAPIEPNSIGVTANEGTNASNKINYGVR